MWMCEKLGVEPDASCKDASRGFFLTSTENFLYDDLKQMYADEADDAFVQKYEPEYRAGRSQGSSKPISEVKSAGDCLPGSGPQAKSQATSLLWKRNGGVPQEGERNVKLYQLAVNLRAICDNNKALLLQVMPRLGLDEQEMQSIVESACKEPPKGFSKVIREIMGASPNPLQKEGAIGSAAESPLPRPSENPDFKGILA